MKPLLTDIKAICHDANRLILLLVSLFLFCSFSVNAFGSPAERSVLSASVISSEYFPCSRCHQKGVEPDLHREIFHTTIRVIGHAEENYDCFGCHAIRDLDKLRLFNGSTIDLAVSSELCGQCHSTNFKLWQSGLHGKVIGKWNGPKKYTPCTTCHDPHRPKYKEQKPEPPPTHPEQTLRWRR